MRILCSTQRTQEWFEARCGKVTGSNAWKVMNKLKEHANYREIIIAETLSAEPVRNYVSPYMDEGSENEPLARAAYEQLLDVEVRQTGFLLHPTIDRFGSSPDGLLPRGCVEFKCPAQNTHVGYMTHRKIPSKYYDQMQSEIVCAEADWCDFVSYCPLMAPPFDLYRVRVVRDDKRIAEIEAAVLEFLEEVAQEIKQMAAMLGGETPGRKLKNQLRQAVQEAAGDPEDFTGEGYAFLDRNELERVP